jgi:hypothetical protein
MVVRRIDKFIHLLMWASLAISLLVIGGVIVEHFYRSDWPYAVAICLLWLPPALSLWKWDGEKPGPQSAWFYRFAILTLLLGATVAAYGYFLFR